MKKFLLPLFSVCALASLSASAQIKRCATDEMVQKVFAADPQAKIRYETAQRLLEAKVKAILSNPGERLMRTNAIVNVPVVVHVIAPNPALVTDALIQGQLDTLNKYYSGGSDVDSLRVYSPFRNTYGRSGIRFCLAKRTPNGTNTSGIERLTSTQTFQVSTGSIHPSSIVSAWNTQTYLNIWVVVFTDQTLGYSYLPGTFPPGDQHQGFVVDYRSFGSGATHLYSGYNLGKTAVHEIGHYFNLAHPWGSGNGNSGCTADDGCTDTPKTNGPTFGCILAGPVTASSSGTNTCSPAAPGIMWQNHMDYADDACMLLFTVQQCARMEAALSASSDRTGLATSNGCLAVPLVPNDAAITSISKPTANQLFCSNSVAPQITLTNNGTAVLTAVSINVSDNGVAGTPYSWTGNLAPGASTNLTLGNYTLSNGNNSLVFSTSLPNGVPDGNTANDVLQVFVTYKPATGLPLSENFESTQFPPGQWSLANPGNDFTWMRGSPGKVSTGALFINNYDDDATDDTDDFISQPVNTGGNAGITISFDLAHKFYPDVTNYDTLSVRVSGDCGTTWQTVYKKWGPTLATADSSSFTYLNPAANDWRSESLFVNGTVLASGQVLVAFRNTTRFGNNIFIDNINIGIPTPRDLKLNAILAPATLICANSITPQVNIKNESTDLITSYKIGYSIDNGTPVTQTFTQSLSANQTTTLTLGAIAVAPGNHSMTLFTADPVSAGGSGDVNRLNDTLRKSFTIPGQAQAPLVEGFQSATFPPSNWGTINADNGITWSRNVAGKGNPGSAFVNTFAYTNLGQSDFLVLPEVSYPKVDSVKLSFDLAAAPYKTIGGSDTLEVMITKDCGNSFTSVYKKWGNELRTTTAQAAEFIPLAGGQWRTEVIDLSEWSSQSPVMAMFKITNNKENNIFIDNVNLATRTLPDLLKRQGFLVLPTPFSSNFTIWHYQNPTALAYVNVYTAAGQLVWSQQYASNASRYISVDLSAHASGMYFVKLGYTDEKLNRTIKVMKK